MKTARVPIAFVPLADAAPLVVAHEMGFAAEEGLAFELVRAPSWSYLRDMLSFGRVDAAHMLAPVPVATALGLGGSAVAMDVLMVLSVNGNVIAVDTPLARRMRDGGHSFAFDDAREAGEALLEATGRRLRIGVPFSFSMHAELLSYWLSSVGLSAIQGIDIRTVPPPLMAEAVRAGEVDAFCVGEPWGTLAVENGLGELLLPTSAIWSFAPEKVLAVRKGWAADAPRRAEAMVRAIWRAGRWLAKPTNRLLAAEILSRPAYLDLPAEMIERALTGKLVISPRGEERRVDTFVEFYRNAAMFPWHSQARWISHRLAARAGIGEAEAMEKGKQVFRTDIFRAALAGTGADLPAKSSRPEGANPASGVFTGESGKPIPPPNVFFDCRVFDPDAK